MMKENFELIKRFATGETTERTWRGIRTIRERGRFPVHPLSSTSSSARWAKAFGRYHLQSAADPIQP